MADDSPPLPPFEGGPTNGWRDSPSAAEPSTIRSGSVPPPPLSPPPPAPPTAPPPSSEPTTWEAPTEPPPSAPPPGIVAPTGAEAGAYGSLDDSWAILPEGQRQLSQSVGAPNDSGRSRSRRPMIFIGLGAAIVILVVAVIAVVGSSKHSPSPVASPPKSHTDSTGRTSTSTTVPRDAESIAVSIGLQSRDLAGFAFVKSTNGAVVDAASAATECAPVTGPASWANVSSGLYTDNSNSVLALVELLPTAADAQAGLTAVTAPPVGASCIQPQGDTFVKAILNKVNLSSSCPLSLTSSTVTPLTSAAAWPGATGFRYVASLNCGSQQAGVTADFVDETVGNVFLEGRFILFGGPQPGLEQNVMNAMAARAQAYVSSH